MLLHLVDLAPAQGEPRANYETVRAELGSYGAGLDRLPELVVLAKSDLLAAGALEAELGRWQKRLGRRVLGVLAVSSVSGEGLGALQRGILASLSELPCEVGSGERLTADFEAEHRLYRPAGEGGYRVEREADGGFRVIGEGVELLFARHDLANEEALAYLEQRLAEIGVIAALGRAGFEPGDELRIGDRQFDLHPGS